MSGEASLQPVQLPTGPHIGIYGWRKRCLYLLILGLLVLVIVNLALTLWVLKVMALNTDGMGDLSIVSGGVQLSGQAYVMDTLLASNIRSRQGQPITFQSYNNLTINTRDQHGSTINRIFLDGERFEVVAPRFAVSDPKGQDLFTVDRDQVVVGADLLRVTGIGGAVFGGSVQTPLVRAGSGSNLSLESPTRSLQIVAPAGVTIESRAGDISASCLTDLKLESLDGAIRLEASSVLIPDLKTAQHKVGRQPRTQDSPPEVYQLCVCSSGKLFLGDSHGACVTDNEFTCR